jgi:hypothetical protein
MTEIKRIQEIESIIDKDIKLKIQLHEDKLIYGNCYIELIYDNDKNPKIIEIKRINPLNIKFDNEGNYYEDN